MHTVIASECTGCDLCVEPCPVDCIDLIPLEQGVQHWVWEKPQGDIIASDRPAKQENAA